MYDQVKIEHYANKRAGKMMLALYAYTDEAKPIQTIHGKLRWWQFCELEKKRIEKSPGRVVEIRRNYKNPRKMTVFVNRVA
jgi:hypothetical protein